MFSCKLSPCLFSYTLHVPRFPVAIWLFRMPFLGIWLRRRSQADPKKELEELWVLWNNLEHGRHGLRSHFKSRLLTEPTVLIPWFVTKSMTQTLQDE